MIKTQSNLITTANIIKNETQDRANTATRVGTQLVDTVDTLFNKFCRIDKIRKNSLKYTISGYDYTDVQLQVVKWNRKGKCWKFVSGSGLTNQRMQDLENRFVDANEAISARPRVVLNSANGTLTYSDTLVSSEITVLLDEMAKLRTIEHFSHNTGKGYAIWYNIDRAGGYYNCEAGSYDEGSGNHHNAPRYGLALTYRGVIVSNVLPVKIGYNSRDAVMIMSNI